MNKVPYIQSENSLTIFWEGKPYTLRKDHPNFNNAKKAILDGEYDRLGDLVDIAKSVEDFVEGDIEVKDEVVYYKGHRLHGVVVDKLIEMLRAGAKDSAPIVNFITRLQANPSANSVAELYTFLGYKSLPTTPEGLCLGYKGVQGDYWSSTGNADTIVVQGQTNERHQILNEVGATIEVARRCVDDNRDNHCSFGLHVGSYDYANNWAGESGRLLVVEFDPADAVSVPTDCDFQKLRVSKYRVVSDITDTRKELNRPVYEANKPIYGSDDDINFDEDEEDENDWVDQGEWDDDDSDWTEDEHRDFVAKEFEDDDEPDGYNGEEDNRISLVDSYNVYIGNRLHNGQKVTLKHLADLKVSRDEKLTCSEIMNIVNKETNYFVRCDDDRPLYLYEVEV